MSTGLTWLTIVDNNDTPPTAYGFQTFNDYNEAVKYALWFAKFEQDAWGGGIGFQITIYTTSPNPNGSVNAAVVPPEFIPFD